MTSAIRALAVLAYDDFTGGEWDDAQRLVDEAVDLCETHGYGPLALRPCAVQLAYGERLRRNLAMAESRDHLQAAAETFRRLGAEPWAARAAAERHATGLRRSRQDGSQRASLTPQEQEIASLAARGLTNKQIGEQLFLSHRTVGAHLYRLFRSWGSSRERRSGMPGSGNRVR